MYYAGAFLGLRPLPQLLNEPLLSVMPGFVFGFLIDTLQHAGKVIEEAGLILLMLVLLGLLGAAGSVASLRWTSRYLPFAFAGVGWLLVVAVAGWRLKVGGLAAKPLSLSVGDLRALPATEQYVTLSCISNNVGGNLISTGLFKGVPLRDLLAMASPQPGASWVAFRARDGYTESVPMSVVLGAPEVLVAYGLDGPALPMNHGFPARVLIPGRYGMKQPKWLDSIELAGDEARGYWEQQGWDHNALVKTTARFDLPRDGEILKLGAMEIGGVAFAGTRGVSKVEYSTNGGAGLGGAPFWTPPSPPSSGVGGATCSPRT